MEKCRREKTKNWLSLILSSKSNFNHFGKKPLGIFRPFHGTVSYMLKLYSFHLSHPPFLIPSLKSHLPLHLEINPYLFRIHNNSPSNSVNHMTCLHLCIFEQEKKKRYTDVMYYLLQNAPPDMFFL